MVDVGGPRIQADRRKLAQGNIRRCAGGVLVTDPDIANRFNVIAVFGREANGDVPRTIAFQERRRDRSAHRRLNDGIHVARIEAIAGRLLPIDRDVEVRLPNDVKGADIFHTSDLLYLVAYLKGKLFELLQVMADDLDRVGTFDARSGLLDIVLYVLREIEGEARHRVGKLPQQLRGQLVLAQARGPLAMRFQRHEQFDVGKRRRIAAVVGPAMLRNRGDDFRVAQQNFTDLPDALRARRQAHRRWHRQADPVIAFLERGQEFAAESRRQQSRDEQERGPDPDHDLP